MLYHKNSKNAFVMVPRSASTSLKHFLMSIGFKLPLVFAPNPAGYYSHPKYAEAIAQYPNLSTYTTYGVFRDPLDRFLSGLRLVWKQSVDSPSVNPFDISLCDSYDELVDRIFGWAPHHKLPSFAAQDVFSLQSDWITSEVTAIAYASVSVDVRRITRVINVSDLPFVSMNRSPSHPFGEPSEAVVQFAKERFAVDYQLAASRSIEVESA